MDDKSGVERLNEVQNTYIILNIFPEIAYYIDSHEYTNFVFQNSTACKIHVYLRFSVICKYEQKGEKPESLDMHSHFRFHTISKHLLL